MSVEEVVRNSGSKRVVVHSSSLEVEEGEGRSVVVGEVGSREREEERIRVVEVERRTEEGRTRGRQRRRRRGRSCAVGSVRGKAEEGESRSTAAAELG